MKGFMFGKLRAVEVSHPIWLWLHPCSSETPPYILQQDHVTSHTIESSSIKSSSDQIASEQQGNICLMWARNHFN